MKTLKIIIFSLLSLFVLALIGIFIYLKIQFSPVSKNIEEPSVRFEVSYGSSALDVIYDLKEKNIIRNTKIMYYLVLRPKLFSFCYKDIEYPSKMEFKSGLYNINPNMNYAQIISLLTSGKQEYLKVSIPEGLTISKIATILEEEHVCNKDDFIKECSNQSIIDEYKIPFNSLEGYLFPETYYFEPNMTASLVVKKLVDTFFNKIKTIPNLSHKTPEELNQIVILASIVEREYKIDDEAPIIASVFTNRIKHNIGLYSCATIEYIITEIQGKPHPEKIYNSDLQIDNPYNTYKWEGLTPGPISNPGIVALNAACNPAKTDYYYFQVVDASSGRHVFKKTFDEHRTTHLLVK